MSEQFRELLKKVGSGQHTSKELTREEACLAGEMMLQGIATPAQIGAFLIAHRIKRPTSQEMTGLLDAFDHLSQKIAPIRKLKYPVTVFGVPYDGRDRTAPIVPLTALILAVCGVPVILHGGDRMPTKYGVSLVELWQKWGIDFSQLSLEKVRECLEKTGLTFYYTPKHFPAVRSMNQYREEIGKRPPIATLELMWSPYSDPSHLIAGYVHPPTEKTMRESLTNKGINHYTLVKGLEGSCDLKLSQTTIIAIANTEKPEGYEYLKMNGHEYQFSMKDAPFISLENTLESYQHILQGQPSPLLESVLWNGGFYLWRCGICETVAEGINHTQQLLQGELLREKWQEIQSFIQQTQSQ